MPRSEQDQSWLFDDGVRSKGCSYERVTGQVGMVSKLERANEVALKWPTSSARTVSMCRYSSGRVTWVRFFDMRRAGDPMSPLA